MTVLSGSERYHQAVWSEWYRDQAVWSVQYHQAVFSGCYHQMRHDGIILGVVRIVSSSMVVGIQLPLEFVSIKIYYTCIRCVEHERYPQLYAYT